MIRRFVAPIIDGQTWADGPGRWTAKLAAGALGPFGPLKDFLHGTWLGHPLHPALTDVPIGAFTVAIVFDLSGLPGAEWVIVVGLAGMVAAALAGIADYIHLSGRALRHGTVHSYLMVASLLFYAASAALRFGGPPESHAAAVVLAVVGYVILALGAYLGGELVFTFGSQVDRNSFGEYGRAKRAWVPLEAGQPTEGRLVKGRAGGEPILLLQRGGRVLAMHDTCAHQGCSLSEGTIVDDTVECACHGSRFRLSDGAVVRGPAVFDQPLYEIRRAGIGWEARPRSPEKRSARGPTGSRTASRPGPAPSA